MAALTAAALLFACTPAPGAREGTGTVPPPTPKVLVVSPAPPEATGSAGVTPAPGQATAAPAPGESSEADATPAGTDQPTGVTPPPQGCDGTVEVSWSCWTVRFPKTVSGRSDIACRFAVTCCGRTVQSWTHSYPEAAGPSGVAGGETIRTQYACQHDPSALGLGDLDGDGAPNPADPNPAAPGTDGVPWE
jgi:hypothetical protein